MRTVLLFLLGAVTAGTAETELTRLLARRDYDAAVARYTRQCTLDSAAATATRSLAHVYDHWRKYDSSLHWWNRTLELEPSNDSARLGRWHALYRLHEDDSIRLAETRTLIAKEVLATTESDSAAASPENLTLAFDGFALANPVLKEAVGLLLTTHHPNSPRGHDIIGGMFYDSLYPIWRDDTLKAALLGRFLRRFPETEWRATMYVYLLSSLSGLEDTTGALQTAEEMVADDPNDPFRARYAAAILNRMKLEPGTAEAYARRAIALEPHATKPPNKPQEQWELEYPTLYGSARLALAEALQALDSIEPARTMLLEATSGSNFGPDIEATLGPYYTLLGEINEQANDTSAAANAFVNALIQGDSRNRWSPRADSGLRRLWELEGTKLVSRARKTAAYDGPRFTDITAEAGLDSLKGSRVAWGDYDNDGYDDLLVSGSRLFRNDSGNRFTEVTGKVGLKNAKGRGAVWADFDNDGWLDFYMCGGDTIDRLWRNCQGRFSDVTKQTGRPSNPGPTEGAAWADFDNDGLVDLYAANYENRAEQNYWPDRLYQNRPGEFTDITTDAEIIPPYGEDRAGRGVAWADYDDDGRQDCFVANYRLQENFLWHNRGDSTFENTAAALGIAGDEVDGWFGHTIGAAWGDYDNDGDLDLFTADLVHPRYIEFSNRSRLYENLGPDSIPRFRDRRAAAGIRYEETHSNPAWADVDNDGDLDLYITSIYENRRSFLYENMGRPHPDSTVRFRDVTWLSGTRAFNGWGCAFADIDRDGDMDLVVGSGSGLKLFRNDTRNPNHWLRIKVVGTEANRAGIGCRITVTRGDDVWIREVEGGSGTTSQNSFIQQVGLGPSDSPVSVEVRFGPQSLVRLNAVEPNQLVVVREKKTD